MSIINQASNSSVRVNPNLHIDIIIDILSRLPVKPLLRFTSVSKTWYALIQNPNFIKKHQKKLNENLNLTLTSVLVTDDLLTYHSMWLRFRDKIDNPEPTFLFQDHPLVLGICDGLVCATINISEIFICNPTTRRIRNILGFTLPKVEQDSETFGFGLHENDYKLFRIIHLEVGFRAEVYSVNTNIWREIELNTSELVTRVGISQFDNIPVAIKEVFYWKGHSDIRCVVSFDMNGYMFGIIACPEEILRAYRPYWRIHDVRGELALTVCRNVKWFEMWVLNENEKSWTMKLKVDDIPSIGRNVRLLGCERNGNLVMQHFTPALDIELFSYDPESHIITYLPFWGLKQRHVVCLYTESLLLV